VAVVAGRHLPVGVVARRPEAVGGPVGEVVADRVVAGRVVVDPVVVDRVGRHLPAMRRPGRPSRPDRVTGRPGCAKPRS
jgi:hypothetical protein